MEITHAICAILDDLRPRKDGRKYAELITFVKDRAGHDLRYAIDPEKSPANSATNRTKPLRPASSKPSDGI